jgi:translation elongation factor EF-1alpha
LPRFDRIQGAGSRDQGTVSGSLEAETAQVSWSQDRYDEIVDALRPFLVSAGFTASKTTFLPLGAMEGVNVLVNEEALLKEWYNGPTLIDTLGKRETPNHPIAV